MFNGCESLATINLAWLDLSKVSSVSNMFECCAVLEELDLSKVNAKAIKYADCIFAVSYTHLDVYKRQPLMTSKHVLKDDINYISHYANTTLVQEAIKEAENYLKNKENSQPKVTTGMFDNCNPLPAEMRKNFKFTDEEIRYLSGIGEVYKNYKPTNFEIMQGPMPHAPIQDENRFLCFRVEGKEYSLRIVSKEEMQRVKEEVNKNSKYTYDSVSYTHLIY